MVGQPAGEQAGEEQAQDADGVDGERMIGRDAVGGLQPAHDVEEHQVIADGQEHREAAQSQQQGQLVAHRRHHGRLAVDAHGNLLETAAQREAGEADEQAEQERQAPSPGGQVLGRH